MKFLNNTRDPQTPEDSAFAERLRSIATRSKGPFEPDSAPESMRIPEIERRFWNPADVPGADEQAAAF